MSPLHWCVACQCLASYSHGCLQCKPGRDRVFVPGLASARTVPSLPGQATFLGDPSHAEGFSMSVDCDATDFGFNGGLVEDVFRVRQEERDSHRICCLSSCTTQASSLRNEALRCLMSWPLIGTPILARPSLTGRSSFHVSFSPASHGAGVRDVVLTVTQRLGFSSDLAVFGPLRQSAA